MKINLLATSLVIFSGYAAAVSNNTVQFQGEVNTQTCSVNVNGSDTTPIVLLPTVSTNSLSTAQATAGSTKFLVNITGCNTAAATIHTEFTGNNITTNGNLGNTGTAANVSIQILDSDGSTPLNFVNGSTVKTTAFVKSAGLAGVSQELTARYYAESTDVSAGSVVATTQYSIDYQ